MNNSEQLRYQLESWNKNSADAERLIAKMLVNMGYKFVSTQNPRGGRDGKKDILCNDFKNNPTVVGVYFPISKVSETEIEKKFKNDLKGASRNKITNFLFCSNCYIRAKLKSQLKNFASATKINANIYDVEDLENFLNSPSGYGIRNDYFNIELSKEEITSLLDSYIHNQNEIIKQIAMQTMTTINNIIIGNERSTLYCDLKSHCENFKTKDLNIENLKKLNYEILAQYSLPDYLKGNIRSIQSWIGPCGQGIENAIFIPEKPELIIEKLTSLIEEWNSNKESLVYNDNIYYYLAKSHLDFLKIHPLYDGNGRISRIILSKQIFELKKRLPIILIKEQSEYYEYLKTEDINSLAILLKNSIYL